MPDFATFALPFLLGCFLLGCGLGYYSDRMDWGFFVRHCCVVLITIEYVLAEHLKHLRDVILEAFQTRFRPRAIKKTAEDTLQQSTFLQLPIEIRLMIYHFALTSDHPVKNPLMDSPRHKVRRPIDRSLPSF